MRCSVRAPGPMCVAGSWCVLSLQLQPGRDDDGDRAVVLDGRRDSSSVLNWIPNEPRMKRNGSNLLTFQEAGQAPAAAEHAFIVVCVAPQAFTLFPPCPRRSNARVAG